MGGVAPPRGRWAQRVEVDANGVPIPQIAEGNKVYGEMGTIGVGTLLLENIDSSVDGASGAATGGSEEQKVADGDEEVEEEEIEEESDESVATARESAMSAENDDIPDSVSRQNSSFLRSSITSQFLQKLRADGQIPGGPSSADKSNGNIKSPTNSSSTGSVKHPHASLPKVLGLPSSFREREAKTTTETEQLRDKLRGMGILDQGGMGSPSAQVPGSHPTGFSNTVAASEQAAAGDKSANSTPRPAMNLLHPPSHPSASVSPNASVMLSSSGSHEKQDEKSSSRGSTAPAVHASLASLPFLVSEHLNSPPHDSAVSRESTESAAEFCSSQASTGCRSTADCVSFVGRCCNSSECQCFLRACWAWCSRFSRCDSRPAVVIEGLCERLSVNCLFRCWRRPACISCFPSVASTALGESGGVQAATTDLDTLADVYEQQLLTMQAVLAQVLPMNSRNHLLPCPHRGSRRCK